jgi:hypothetical protein
VKLRNQKKWKTLSAVILQTARVLIGGNGAERTRIRSDWSIYQSAFVVGYQILQVLQMRCSISAKNGKI